VHDPTWLLFVSNFRDWVIIVAGILIAAFFFVSLIVAIVLGWVLWALVRKVMALLDDGGQMLDERVKPLLGSVRETADHVKGTATYVSNAAVTPIVRTYGVVAGVRRAVGVITGLTGASNEPREK
jgi:hypothetical protein